MRVSAAYTALSRAEWALARVAGGEGALAGKYRHPAVAPYLRALQRQFGQIEASLVSCRLPAYSTGWPLKVLHAASVPFWKPTVNQCTRAADEPCVHCSGLTSPLAVLLDRVVADGLGGRDRLLDVLVGEVLDQHVALGVLGGRWRSCAHMPA